MILPYSKLNVYNLNTVEKTSQVRSKEAFDATKEANNTIYVNATDYGFKADDRGFLDPILNEIIGIPADMKIHISTMDRMSQYVKKTKSGLNTLEGLSKAWDSFKGLVGDVIDTTSEQFIQENTLKNLPAEYIATDGTIFENVKKWYDFDKQPDEQFLLNSSNGMFSTGRTTFLLNAALCGPGYAKCERENFNTDVVKGIPSLDFYEDLPDDQISLSQMFNAFIMYENFAYDSCYINGRTEPVKNYYKYLKSGKSMEEAIGKERMKELKSQWLDGIKADRIAMEYKIFDDLFKALEEGNKEYYIHNKSEIDNIRFTQPKKPILKAYNSLINLNI